MANSYFCRYLRCGNSFDKEVQRLHHENLMHKEMLKESAFLLLQRIESTNTPENFKKKVLKTSLGKFSYAEAKEKIKENTEEGKVILEMLKNIVEGYFSQYPDYGMDQMLKVSEFRIQ